MTKKTYRDEELVAIVDHEFENGIGAPGGQLSAERAEAIRAYEGTLKIGDENDGETKLRTSDVADVVDAIIPSLLRIFTTPDNLVTFEPVTEDDESQAEQESDYVNHLFWSRDDATILVHNWMHDALLQKGGIVKAYWDKGEHVTYETYEGLSETDLATLLDDPELEPIERAEREVERETPGEELTDEVLAEAASRGLSEEDLRALVPEFAPQKVTEVVHDVLFRRVKKQGCVAYEGVPPDEYRVSSDARHVNPNKVRFVGHERSITRSELVEMGYPKTLVWGIPADHSLNIRTDEQQARHNKTDDTGTGAPDKSQEQVRYREAYVLLDVDGDGRSERRMIVTAGNTLLENKPVDRVPFHLLTPRPKPHKHIGQSVADLVMEIYKVNTTLLRQTIMNLYHTNNPTHGVWEQGMGENTLDDLLTRTVGGVARFARPPQESYSPIVVPFTAGESFAMMEKFEQMKRQRTGVHLNGEGLTADSLKNIQQSVMAQTLDMSRMQIEAIARIFAETGFRSLFQHTHELVHKHDQREQIVKLRGKWVKVDPREWRTRYNTKVSIGLGLGTRDQNLVHIRSIMEAQALVAQDPGLRNLVIKPRNVFNALSRLVRNSNLDDPELYFTDPKDAELPPVPDELQELEQRQLEAQERQQQLDQAKQQLDQAKIQLKHQQEQLALEQKAAEAEDKFIVENERLRTQVQQLELKAAQLQAQTEVAFSKLAAEIQNINADTLHKRALSAKLMEEARGVGLEVDAVESGLAEAAEPPAAGGGS